MDTRAPRLSREMLHDAVRTLQAVDRHLDRCVTAMGVPPLWARPAGFATLVQIILEQQVSLASAHAVYRRLSSGVGNVSVKRIAETSHETLRSFGLTRQKAGYCLDLAKALSSREIDLGAINRASDDEAHAELLKIRGIGTWSASIYLLMGLRRPDVWPDGDVALAESARVVKQLDHRPSYEELRAIAEQWRPWRSVAARILWHDYLCRRRTRRGKQQSMLPARNRGPHVASGRRIEGTSE